MVNTNVAVVQQGDTITIKPHSGVDALTLRIEGDWAVSGLATVVREWRTFSEEQADHIPAATLVQLQPRRQP